MLTRSEIDDLIQPTLEDQAITERAVARGTYNTTFNAMQIDDMRDAEICAEWLEHLAASGWRPETWEHLIEFDRITLEKV